MTRQDQTRYLGGLAACLLALGVSAPMIVLRDGTYGQSFGTPVRLTYLAIAIGASLASWRRAFWIAALLGALAFANALLVLTLTFRGIGDGQMHAWARPGWGFLPLLVAGLILVTLPFWAGGEQRNRPSA